MTTSSIDHIDFALHPARTPVPAAERDRLLAEPGFGQIFTDHMVTARWSHDIGWHDGQLEPYGPITLQPATSVLHYAQEIFEGLKAFRQVNGQIVAFRPDANAARFMVSATRMAMPVFPEAAFVQAIDLLVGQDHAWVPASQNQSLYLRPFMIATDPCLGLSRPSRTFLFALIASPAGAYFGGSLRPVSVWLAQDYPGAAAERDECFVGAHARAFAAGEDEGGDAGRGGVHGAMIHGVHVLGIARRNVSSKRVSIAHV